MSFVFAFRGIKKGFEGRNMKVHGIAAILVVFAGWCKNLSFNEWVIILILIALVLSSELINSSIEELNNTVKKELKLSYSATTDSRNLASGSVLVLAIIAAIIGLVIFL